MPETELAAKTIKELSEVEKRQDAERNSLKKREISLAAEVVRASNEIISSLKDVADQSLKSELGRLQSDLKETVRMGITETAKPGEKSTVRM